MYFLFMNIGYACALNGLFQKCHAYIMFYVFCVNLSDKKIVYYINMGIKQMCIQ